MGLLKGDQLFFIVTVDSLGWRLRFRKKFPLSLVLLIRYIGSDLDTLSFLRTTTKGGWCRTEEIARFVTYL